MTEQEKVELKQQKESWETGIYKNAKRLESALLEYIEENVKDTTPEIAATIPSVAMALIELWKTI